MGVLEIPCIEVELPIYHGIGEEVLQKGVGHISQTAFPVGGEGNHTVLSTHRGLPDAKLFSDLDEGKDYVTLLTCTPYGINSHRLLVRGSRVNYVPEVKAQIQKKVVRTEKYTVFGIGAAAILVVAAGVAGRIRKRKRKQV